MAKSADSPRPTSKYDRHLARRLDQIEALLEQVSHQFGLAAPGQERGETRYPGECAMPKVPERTFGPGVSAQREELIRYIDRKWVNGTVLHYYLFDEGAFAGTDYNMDKVREAFGIWEDVGIGVGFEETDDLSEAEVRVGFQRGGSWSYVGRDVIDVPGQNERTMNIGWDLRQDARGVDVAVHEVGHTLGFPHEHQNPFSGIVWDEEAVYRHFAQPPNGWDRDRTFHNILRKLTTKDVEGTSWDPDSIMHYAFGPGLILSPAQYRNGITPARGLSEADIAEICKLYPKDEAEQAEELRPFESTLLDLEASEQKNFVLRPTASREFTIRVFGQADVLMVLFRRENGRLRYVAGSDDSGTEDNASIAVRMVQGEEYVLRVRMFSVYGNDRVALMSW